MIMMTSSNGNIAAILTLCVGNSVVNGEFPTQRQVALLALVAVNSPVNGEFPTQMALTRGFDIFFDIRLN